MIGATDNLGNHWAIVDGEYVSVSAIATTFIGFLWWWKRKTKRLYNKESHTG